MKSMNTMKFTKTVMKNLFSKPVTRLYPEVPREYPERTRGHIEIDMDTCILCGLCSRKCPTGAITVDRTAKTWEIERFGCIQCGCCVEVCPKKCLSMKQQYTEPGAHKTDDQFIKPETPGTAKPAAASTEAKPAAAVKASQAAAAGKQNSGVQNKA